MISTQVRQSFDSSHPLVVPGLDEHSSLSLSSSLKNETDPPPLQSILTLDRVLEPSFPPPSENVSISNQKPKRGKKKSHWRKRCLGGRSPASGHHAGEKPPTSAKEVGGKLPLERHAARSDPRSKVIPIVM
jgi:hypothetical protein